MCPDLSLQRMLTARGGNPRYKAFPWEAALLVPMLLTTEPLAKLFLVRS